MRGGRRRNGSKHLKGTRNHQLQKFTPPVLLSWVTEKYFAPWGEGEQRWGLIPPGLFLCFFPDTCPRLPSAKQIIFPNFPFRVLFAKIVKKFSVEIYLELTGAKVNSNSKRAKTKTAPVSFESHLFEICLLNFVAFKVTSRCPRNQGSPLLTVNYVIEEKNRCL